MHEQSSDVLFLKFVDKWLEGAGIGWKKGLKLPWICTREEIKLFHVQNLG